MKQSTVILSILQDKPYHMSTLHPNYIKASNLVCLLLAIGLVNIWFITAPKMGARNYIIVFTLSIFFLGGMAYFLRKGAKWIKYVFLVIFISSHLRAANWIKMFNRGLTGILPALLIISLSIWILWLLFTIPGNNNIEKKIPMKKGSGVPEPDIDL